MDIGEVCNVKLGSPYRKCRAVFAEARADCSDLLGEFNFLCDIIDVFLPLCSLARGAFTDITTSVSAIVNVHAGLQINSDYKHEPLCCVINEDSLPVTRTRFLFQLASSSASSPPTSLTT